MTEQIRQFEDGANRYYYANGVASRPSIKCFQREAYLHSGVAVALHKHTRALRGSNQS